jgi:peptidoglycan/LPS O-acetylase OafA/YrhL
LAAAIIAKAPRPPAGRFFRNRALRIYPAYVVIFLMASYALQTGYAAATNDDTGVDGVEGSSSAAFWRTQTCLLTGRRRDPFRPHRAPDAGRAQG